MKKIVLLGLGITMSVMSFSQTFITRNAYIKFYSTTPIEDIEAASNQASSVLDLDKKQIVFQVLMNSFQFEKALMQEHFNENYIESAKYPKGIFKGEISSTDDLTQEGVHKVKIKGNLNVHGKDKPIDTEMTLTKKEDDYLLEGVFNVSPADFDIPIPSAVENKIGKSIEVTVKSKYQIN